MKRLARWLRDLADRVDGEPGSRKPKWSHPCQVCNARGYVAPHQGQHTVAQAPEPVPPLTSMPPTALETRQPPATAATITVPLVGKAAADLAALEERTGLSRTDIVNRALAIYEFVDSERGAGGKITVRRDGTDYDIALL